jgi:hypothetical protein
VCLWGYCRETTYCQATSRSLHDHIAEVSHSEETCYARFAKEISLRFQANLDFMSRDSKGEICTSVLRQSGGDNVRTKNKRHEGMCFFSVRR